jgi:hypothetical protein
MADYININGNNIPIRASDPSNPTIGEIWYNSTTNLLKGQSVTSSGSFSSGATLPTNILGGGTIGSKTAGVYTTGFSPSVSDSTATVNYDGTTWTSSGAYPRSSNGSLGGAGSQAAGMIAGGGPGNSQSAANDYDGSTWTATGSLNTAGNNIGDCGAGPTNDVIFAIGRTAASGNTGSNVSETFDGTSFSPAPNINLARLHGVGGGAGTGTAGLIMGGFIDPSPNAVTNVEEYNGASWSNVNTLNTASGLNSGFGTQTSAIMQVNSPGPGSRQGVEEYDGTCFATAGTLSSPAGGYTNSTGTSAAGGWYTALGGSFNATEEWTGAGIPETKTISSS